MSFKGPRDGLSPYNLDDFADQPVPQRDYAVACHVAETQSQSQLEFTWSFDQRVVTARISASGQMQLAAKNADGDGPRATGRLSSVTLSGAVIVFAVRDCWAYVLEGARLVGEIEVGPVTLDDMRGEFASVAGPCELTLSTDSKSLELRRITVDADIYYRGREDMPFGSPWLHGATKPIELTANQCFVLGDNSARSQDSRFHGPVDWKSVRGVARWCYWPPGRMRELR